MADVQMNYDTVEEMIKIFQNGAQQLGETMEAMKKVAEQMRSGALLGVGGDDFAEALERILAPRIQKMQSKFTELSGDVKFAMDALKRGDTKAAGRFT